MPVVEISRDPEVIGDVAMRDLLKVLLLGVAKALDVPERKEARVRLGDIEFRVRDRHPLDLGRVSLAIEIRANHYPERERNLEERTREVAVMVQSVVPTWIVGNSKAYVWIRLAKGSFEML